jgi:hypothetical protein
MALEAGHTVSRREEYRYKHAVSSNIHCYYKCLGTGIAQSV